MQLVYSTKVVKLCQRWLPKGYRPLDLSGVCSNVWLSAKGFKATGQWLFRCIFFGVMYVVMHVVEGECWDCFFWLHLGFLTLFFWVASSSLGRRRWVSFDTTVFLFFIDPMLCLLNLSLSEIWRIKAKSISDLEEGFVCVWPFSL